MGCIDIHGTSGPTCSFSSIPWNSGISASLQLGLSQDTTSDSMSSSAGGDDNGSGENVDSNFNYAVERPTNSNSALIELPIDGSIIVLLPAAIIAIFGVITSVAVFVNSGDPILSPDQSADAFERVDYSDTAATNCRGLCGSQQDDLDSMRNFMGKFAKENTASTTARAVTTSTF